ncbi:MAG: flagellar biosynthetic protein FliR [Acidobacteria bacterium]|nr:flagellar biosynthetic protein FliR [Acidobacteriota bacterium]MBI3663000.1 flagellar biosynthetic protein FliR [Acidobacteriota bacterium]
MGPQLEQFVTQATFLVVRIGGMVSIAPFFGSRAIPMRVKGALTMLLSAFFYPLYAPPGAAAGASGWLRISLGEFIVGLLMGLALHMVFDAVQLAGQILGLQMGFSLANVIDPNTEVDTPVVSNFHQIFALLIFLQLNVHHWMLRGLAKSFEYIPPGSVSAMPAATEELFRLASGIWSGAVQVAAPVLLATVLTDVALGFLGKISPQFPVLFVGISIKSALGFAVLMGSVVFWPALLESHFQKAMLATERLLHLAR